MSDAGLGGFVVAVVLPPTHLPVHSLVKNKRNTHRFFLQALLTFHTELEIYFRIE